MRITALCLSLPVMIGLSACVTTPEVEAPPVTIVTAPAKTCMDISALERVVIEAKTETFYAITEIENAPYPPIERKEKQVRIIEPEKVIFVDSEGREVTNVCDVEIAPGESAITGG